MPKPWESEAQHFSWEQPEAKQKDALGKKTRMGCARMAIQRARPCFQTPLGNLETNSRGLCHGRAHQNAIYIATARVVTDGRASPTNFCVGSRVGFDLMYGNLTTHGAC
eukprot:9488685-Pyramimonas_sp.AAC.1